MDSIIFESVLTVFHKQISLQNELQEQALRMRTALLSRELNQISLISHTVDQITAEIEQLELERRELVYSANLPESANRNFHSLCSALPENQSDTLRNIHSELQKSIKETSRYTIGNRVILEEILGSIKTNIQLLASTAKPSTGYDFNGKSSSNKRKFFNQVG